MKRIVPSLIAFIALSTSVPAGFAHAASSSKDNTLTRPKIAIAFARVILDEQRAYFYNANKRLIVTIPVSTGVDDQTPLGTFKVFSKSESTFFAPNPSERMRWMTRFTVGREGGNIGFHGIPYTVTKSGEVPFPTPLGVAPSSHGCIRVRVSDAKWIFNNMPIGTTVSVLQSRL